MSTLLEVLSCPDAILHVVHVVAFSNAVPTRLYFIQQLNCTRRLKCFVLDGLDSVARHYQRIRQWLPDRKPPTLYGSALYRMHTIGT